MRSILKKWCFKVALVDLQWLEFMNTTKADERINDLLNFVLVDLFPLSFKIDQVCNGIQKSVLQWIKNVVFPYDKRELARKTSLLREGKKIKASLLLELHKLHL